MRLLIVQRVEGCQYKSVEELREIYQSCKGKGVTVLLDGSKAFPFLGKECLDGCYDYMVADLQYSAGIQGNAGAAILSRDQATHAKAKGLLDFIGNPMQPMECYLTMRGLKTLHIRAEQQVRNA